jgi:hypothetical protein
MLDSVVTAVGGLARKTPDVAEAINCGEPAPPYPVIGLLDGSVSEFPPGRKAERRDALAVGALKPALALFNGVVPHPGGGSWGRSGPLPHTIVWGGANMSAKARIGRMWRIARPYRAAHTGCNGEGAW